MDLDTLLRQRAELDALIAAALENQRFSTRAAPAAKKPAKKAVKSTAPKAKAKSKPKIETSAERRARLKAAREERQRADEESALASLSERDMEELTRALNDQYTGKTRTSTWTIFLTMWRRRGLTCSLTLGIGTLCSISI